ncbi:MAG: hypothetical protein CMJ75_12305, partial [Planctomycetaceae bacterium]|nr:hypothetical protein [Planctomycetaceae bacterium]
GGAQMAPALVQKLLNEVGDDADQLPVLQHALMRIWEAWKEDHNEDEPLGLRHYERTGGMDQALSIHGDEVYDGLPIEEHRRVAERVFKALTERGSDNRAIRRPTTLGDLVKIAGSKLEHVETVVNAYRATGRTFLMPPEEVPLAEETVVDISHESLMRVWHRLRWWVDKETQSARIFIRLAETAELHEQEKAGYYRDTDLQVALAWQEETDRNVEWADRYHPGFDRAIAFLEASNEAQLTEQQQHEAERERQLQEERARAKSQERTLRKMIWLSGGLGLTAVAAVIAFVLAYQASQSSNMYQQFAQRAGNLPESKAKKIRDRNSARLYQSVVRVAQETNRKTRLQSYRERMKALVGQIDGFRDFETLSQQLALSIPRSDQEDIRHWEWYFLDSIRPPLSNAVQADLTNPADLVWNPNETLAALPLGGSSVAIYDPEVGSATLLLEGLTDAIRAMTWSANGALLAAAGGSVVKVWDRSSGLEVANFDGHAAAVLTVAWLPGDKQLVSYDAAGVVHVWQWQSGESTHSLQTELKPTRAAFRPDGIWLAAASDTGALRVWQLSPEAAMQKIASEGSPIRDLTWNRSGDRLAIVRRDGPVEVWQPAEDATAPSTRIVHPQVAAVDWHPDGQHLLVLDAGGRVNQFAPGGVGSETLMATVPAGGTNLTVSADGTCLAVAGADGVIRFRSKRADLSNVTRYPAAESAVHALATGKEGRLLAIGAADGVIRLVDSRDGTLRHALQAHQGRVNALALDEASGRLVSAGADGTVKLWELQEDAQPVTLARDLGSDVTTIFSRDGKQVVWGGSGGQVVLWDLESGQQRAQFDLGGGSVRTLAWSPTNSFLAIGWRAEVGSGDEIVVYDPTTLAKKGSVRVSQEHLVGLHWTSVGERLVSASNPLVGGNHSGVLRLWSMEQADPLAVMYDSTGPLRSFACSPDGERIASVGSDGRLRLWSTMQRQEVIALPDIQAESGLVAWLPAGRRIVTADQAGRGTIWDASESYQRFASQRDLARARPDAEELSADSKLARGQAWARLGAWDKAEVNLEESLSEQSGNQALSVWTTTWVRSEELEQIQPGKQLYTIPTPFKLYTALPSGNQQNNANTENWNPLPTVVEDIRFGVRVASLDREDSVASLDNDDVSTGQFLMGNATISNLVVNTWIVRNFQVAVDASKQHLWKEVRSTLSGGFDFRQTLADNAISASCDLYTRIYSSMPRETGLQFYAVGGFAAWLNGQPLLDGVDDTAAEDTLPIQTQGLFVVSLQAGWNELYVRVFDQPNGGGLRIRMTRSPAELAGELERAGRWQEAVARWQKIVTGSSARPVDRIRYSRAAERAGLVTEALAAVRELQAAYPENKALQDRVTRLSEHAAKTGGGSE